MSNIVLTGGGTAGHCMPNIALLPFLKEKFEKIYYIGSENGIEKNICQKYSIEYFGVHTQKLIRKFTLKNLTIPFTINKGIKQCKKLLQDLQADIVFSKGGYVSFPVVAAAKSLNLPVILHESDFSMGLANKLCAKFSNKILTSFYETTKNVKNSEFVGNPIREFKIKEYNRSYYKKEFGFDEKPVVLIIGGSLGSKALNEVIFSAIDELLPYFNLLHIVGKNNVNYKINKKGYFQIEYMEDIEKAYTVSDICISRSGANAVFELLALKIPTLFIPLPKGISRGDQIENAEYFEKMGVSFTLKQEELTKDTLIKKVFVLYKNRFNLKSQLAINQQQKVSKKIVDVICSYL